MDYRDSHTSPGKGQSYHHAFKSNPYRSMIWTLEKQVLKDIVTMFYKGQTIRHLDFACGTGRILSFLENWTAESCGVDVSSTMLQVARQNVIRSSLIKTDITKENKIGNLKYNLITAFRFFPNADPILRFETMRALNSCLKKDGYIVFNNHLNASYSFDRLYYMIRKRKLSGKMLFSDCQELIASVGLKIVKIYHVGVVPVSKEKTWLPVFVLLPLERMLSKIGKLRDLATNQIFVCCKI